MDAIDKLEEEINRLKTELTKLKTKTDLQAVQKQLTAFMDEIRLLHRGFLVTLEEMIAELNSEGVKRYNGAVKIVLENSQVLTNTVLLEEKRTQDKLDKISEKLNKFSMMV